MRIDSEKHFTVAKYYNFFSTLISINNLPNFLSVIRLVSAPFIFFLIINQRYAICFLVFIISSITDFLDGYYARKLAVCSRFGSMLDPLADKVLAFFFFYGAYLINKIPLWLLLLIVSRDVLIIIVALREILFQSIKKNLKPFKPLFISKLNTFLQMTLALIILADLYLNSPVINTLSKIFIWILGLMTILSGISYRVSYLTAVKSEK